MKYIKFIVFVLVLLGLGYFLLPYTKNGNVNNNSNNNQNSDNANQQPVTSGSVKTFTSDTFGVKFDYNTDQDGDGKADTDVKEAGDKVYVYFTAGPMEQGQWVEKFSKDPNVKLTDAVKAQFLKNISEKDCYATDMGEFYTKYSATAPTLPENTERVIIAYPFPADTTQPFDKNADKCPEQYRLSNGLSYFQMDKNHPDKYFFFSIGQYPIFADTKNEKVWTDTFAVTK
jgi:hypothetical protein